MQSLADVMSIMSTIASVKIQDLAAAKGGTQCLWWYRDTQRSCLWGNPLALVLLPPNLSKSWCPPSLCIDEQHDQREDWEGKLHYLPGFPGRHHRATKNTM